MLPPTQAWLQEGIAWQRDGIRRSTWETSVWPIHGWVQPWMWQSKGDSLRRRSLSCDLCLPAQCRARMTALYDVLVRCCDVTEEGRLTAPPKPAIGSFHCNASKRRKVMLPWSWSNANQRSGEEFTGHRVGTAVTLLPPLPPVTRHSSGQLLPQPPPCPGWRIRVGALLA